MSDRGIVYRCFMLMCSKRERPRLCGDVINSDADTTAEQYDILDRTLSVKTSVLQRRPSDPLVRWWVPQSNQTVLPGVHWFLAQRRTSLLSTVNSLAVNVMRPGHRSSSTNATNPQRCGGPLTNYWVEVACSSTYTHHINTTEFFHFFNKLVEDIRSSTSDVPPPDYI